MNYVQTFPPLTKKALIDGIRSNQGEAGKTRTDEEVLAHHEEMIKRVEMDTLRRMVKETGANIDDEALDRLRRAVNHRIIWGDPAKETI